MGKQSIVVVFCPETEWQGDVIVQKLKDAGITAYLTNRSSANLLGALPRVEMEILVPEEEVPHAKKLIDELLYKSANK